VVLPVSRALVPAEPLPALPAVSEESADVSMREEEALCQAFSETLLTVQDVDEDDAEQPQLCSEYVKDIYSYLHVLEVTFIPPPRSRPNSPPRIRVSSLSVSTGAASRPSQLHAGLRDLGAHAGHPGGLAGPGPLPVPAAAGDPVPHRRRPGSVPPGAAGVSQEAAAGRRHRHAGGLQVRGDVRAGGRRLRLHHGQRLFHGPDPGDGAAGPEDPELCPRASSAAALPPTGLQGGQRE